MELDSQGYLLWYFYLACDEPGGSTIIACAAWTHQRYEVQPCGKICIDTDGYDWPAPFLYRVSANKASRSNDATAR